MGMKTLDDLFLHFMKDMYYAEKQLTKALPKMAKKASSNQLRKAFEDHLKETEGQIERLERTFKLIDETPKGETCQAIEGIIEEGEELIDEASDAETRDAGMIAAAQAAEHYEISRYGTLVSWAKQLGHTEAAGLLQQNLDEEYAANDKLTKLAEDSLNRKAA
jgi:ferritin-like metal-binding protein YciE